MKEMNPAPFVRTIYICCNERDPGETACANRGSAKLQETLKKHVKDNGLKGKVRVMRSSCMDICSRGPNLCVQPENVWYENLEEKDLDEIIRTWINPLS
jgi:(2Fe-2S) ferredoxin